jgi:ABC-2 type transport system ATP-binding protein
MEMLSVQNLTKRYEKFTLDNVSFTLEKGYIMGFIGRNGAGKTTTIKSILNLVHPDGGKIAVLGNDFIENEFACKQKIGLVLGGVDYYPKSKLKTITGVTKRFYDEWDDEVYESCLKRFSLDPDKRVDQLSAGMRVKYSLALALSHHAQLLILDEPTSGLDPISRDDLLELFQELIEDGEKSILFSTHITSDLEKCADFITYIKDGKIIANTDKDGFVDTYRIVKGTTEQLADEFAQKLIGCKQHKFGFEGMIKTEDLPAPEGVEVSPADLESIMIHIERE